MTMGELYLLDTDYVINRFHTFEHWGIGKLFDKGVLVCRLEGPRFESKFVRLNSSKLNANDNWPT